MSVDLKKYKAILFDVDGVIIDSINQYSILLKDLAEKHGAELYDKETFYKLNLGKKFNYWLKDVIPQENYELFKEEFEEKEIELTQGDLINLITGAKELLTELKNNKIMSVLITSKPRDALNKTINKFKLIDLIEYSISGDEVEKFKPDPEGIEHVLNKYKLLKEDVLFIGDTIHDYGAAQNSSVEFIGVNTGVFSSINWKELNINYVDSISMLLNS